MTVKLGQNERITNPITSANVISKIHFWWLKDLVWYGKKHNLKPTDIYETTPVDKSEHQFANIEKAWENQILSAEKKNKKPSLYSITLKIYGGEFFKYTSLLFLVGIIQIMYPILLENTMKYFHMSSQMTSTNAYILATAFTITFTLESVLKHYGIFNLIRLGMHIKIACSQLIFKKILRMPANSIKEKSFANLLSSDVNRIEILLTYLYNLLVIPMQTIAMIYMMTYYVGVIPTVIGFSLIILQTLPLLVLVYKLTLKMRAKQTEKTDSRIFLISEVINGIRAIKIYVWEECFEKLLKNARRREIADYLKISYVYAFMSTISNCNSRVTLFFMIVIHMLRDGLLKVSQVVPLMKILWTLKESFAYVFAAMKCLVDANVSITRIEKFLTDEEVRFEEDIGIVSNIPEDVISINNVIASWTLKPDDKALDGISVNIHQNTVCAIIGSVGTGKSTLIKLILGELLPLSGQVCVNGKVSYVDQHPWLFKGSIRDNILFGEEYDDDRYQKVVEACALLEDLNQLPYGDKTLVGESGSMLSGGQRTRVSLARAVYREADIYLLDDPFSSLDVRVANDIFQNCINELLKGKTRVLVTSNPHYIANADKIVVLKDASIIYEGPFDKYQFSDESFSSFEQDVPEKNDEKDENVIEETKTLLNSHNTKQISQNEPKETDEFIAKGKISNKIIQEYIRAGQSYFCFFLWILGSVSMVIIAAAFDYWIVLWTQEREIMYQNITDTGSNKMVDNVSSTNFLLIISGLVGAFFIITLTKNYIFYRFTLIASRTIHDSMIACLLRAPIKYFELNSSGRILNRFAEDTGNVDDGLPRNIYEISQALLNVITFLLPVVIFSWRYAIIIVVLTYLLYEIYQFYVPTIRTINRLERVAKSPVLASATSCYAGRLTIRSYRAEDIVSKEFSAHQDYHTATHLLSIALGRGFHLMIDLVTDALFALVLFSSIFFKGDSDSAGYVGLSLTQIMNMAASLMHVLKQSFELISCMINAERMLQYTKLEQEELATDELEMKLPKSWPREGKLEFQHIYLRYSDDIEPALKDINLVIEPGTKVGVVGRTGAGKTSLVSLLFRLTKIEGSMLIDGIDTAHINLADLRSKLSILPQQPTLFNTSLRNNLDPHNTVDDATLWSAINDVELQNTFDSLDYIIDKNGSNLSFGQRQLLCLARVIVKRNKILVLDEATANLDAVTEAIIQKTIKSKFKDCTVISVAHKLTTIIDSDMVLVMDNGQVVEYDRPHVLLQKEGGYFSEMVNQTGDNMSQQLKSIAKQVYLGE